MSASTDSALLQQAPIRSMAGLGGFLRALWQYSPAHVVVVLLCSLVVSISEGIGIVLILPLVGLLSDAEASASVVSGPIGWLAKLFSAFGLSASPSLLAVAIVSLLLIHIAVQAVRFRLTADFQSRYAEHLRNSLYDQILRARWVYFTKHRAAELITNLTSRVDDVSLLMYYAIELSVGAVVVTGYLLLSLLLAPGFALLSIVCGGCVVLLLRGSVAKNAAIGALYNHEVEELYATATQAIAAAKVTKAHGRGRFAYQKFATHTGALRGFVQQAATNSAFLQASAQALSAVVLIALLLVAHRLFETSIAALMLLAAIFIRIVPKVTALQSQAQSFLQILPSWTFVSEQLRSAREFQEVSDLDVGAPQALKFERSVAIEQLTFAYPGQQRPVLDGVSLSIPAGSMVVICGESGAGKTTIADLVLGLLEPQQGRVLIDDLSLAPAGVAAWREQLAYVAQDTPLVGRTVAENFAWQSQASELEIWQALADACLLEFVQALPQGLESDLGSHSIRISAGERQRLALACALARQPRLLILDEATNALDLELEARVMTNLRQRAGLAVLFISHHTNPLQFADFVYRLQAGRLTRL